MVVSPEDDLPRGCSPGHQSVHPMIYTLQHGEHTFEEVILVTLRFYICSHCLSMVIPFFQA